MGDLGMHVAHVPLRLGWRPATVYAVLQDIVHRAARPRTASRCRATRSTTRRCSATRGFPLRCETKRIAPGQMNTWCFVASGMDGGVAFSTAQPKMVQRFGSRDGRAGVVERIEIGSQSAWPTVTGAIFEFGFSDAILQMWAAFLAERAGRAGRPLRLRHPAEALDAHRIFDAALRSDRTRRAEPV